MKEVGLIEVVCKNINDEYPIQKQGYILSPRLLSFAWHVWERPKKNRKKETAIFSLLASLVMVIYWAAT